MTSSNESIFRVTGPLCGEFTGDRWTPLTKASDAELWCLFHLRLNNRLSKQSRRRLFETPSRSLWHRCNVTHSYHIAVGPPGEQIHVGISDKEYTYANETMQNELTKCQILEPPIPLGDDVKLGCAKGIYGRYIYISLVRQSMDDGYIQLYNIKVSMGKYIS